ncbi:unnamed protein product [Cuscuta epithymum]|uniref:RRM domain-containing protein n=1 Tax=Cuscuta epithymum TaxID=186058 RepID=A0AAV0G421_9ASTE|nr:unnamed protein product [Cuscuta epithymum]CAH9142293.1 unnamed protein product [Cuscuta epithymum]
MLNLAEYPTQSRCRGIFRQTIPFKTPLTRFQSPSTAVTRPTSCPLQWKSRTGLCSNALNNQRGAGSHLLETKNIDDAYGFDDYNGDDEDEDEDGEFVPVRNMNDWVDTKPRGFGEGKTYDTSVEEKLMKEIEQSRRAQLVNVNKLKNNPVNPGSKKIQTHQEEASTHPRVRLINLPKKRNIHRDLNLAFKGFPGIVDIVPLVSGNRKTRDPICKGIALIYFKSEDGAQRFVEAFSGKTIDFGKVQKHIKCETVSGPSSPKNLQLADESSHDDSDISETDSDGEVSVTFNLCDKQISASEEGVGSKFSLSAIHQKKIEVNEKKKKRAKLNKEKSPKLNIPGSARRLKIKEKAQLTGVLSKYGSNAPA